MGVSDRGVDDHFTGSVLNHHHSPTTGRNDDLSAIGDRFGIIDGSQVLVLIGMYSVECSIIRFFYLASAKKKISIQDTFFTAAIILTQPWGIHHLSLIIHQKNHHPEKDGAVALYTH